MLSNPSQKSQNSKHYNKITRNLIHQLFGDSLTFMVIHQFYGDSQI
ncbi:hypothetical protein pb186bvf_017587 [Paramecium bursaria]